MFGLAGFLVAGGCAGLHPAGTSHAPTSGKVVTAKRIQASGARTAWEALKFNVYSHRFLEDRKGPQRIASRRGQGSLILVEEPLLFLDGVRVEDIGLLRDIPANAISRITVLTGPEGTMQYGLDSVAGVILIETGTGDGADRPN